MLVNTFICISIKNRLLKNFQENRAKKFDLQKMLSKILFFCIRYNYVELIISHSHCDLLKSNYCFLNLADQVVNQIHTSASIKPSCTIGSNSVHIIGILLVAVVLSNCQYYPQYTFWF